MPVLGIIVFCTVFSLGYTAALAWVLERKESRYGQGSYSFTDVFLPASLTLIVVYFLNIVLLIRYARLTLPVDGALCAALALFWFWRERKFKASASRAIERLRAEMSLLADQVQADPSNPVWFERISELYEKLGDTERALEAARRAAALDPAVARTWRVKKLEEDLSAGGQRGGRRA